MKNPNYVPGNVIAQNALSFGTIKRNKLFLNNVNLKLFIVKLGPLSLQLSKHILKLLRFYRYHVK